MIELFYNDLQTNSFKKGKNNMQRLNKNYDFWSDDVSEWEIGAEDLIKNNVDQSIIDSLNSSNNSIELAKKIGFELVADDGENEYWVKKNN